MKKLTFFVALASAMVAQAADFPSDSRYQKSSISSWTHHAGVETSPHESVDSNRKTFLSATYRSPAMTLADGQVVFTDPNTTPLRMPQGVIAIKSFSAQVVDSEGTPTPLTEVYLHHWLIFSKNQVNSGTCGGYLSYLFGVGAETRVTPTKFPEGYALFVNGGEGWGANIHLLRTSNVPDIKSCIECHCENGGGGFQCCPDGSFCPTGNSPNPEKTYMLEYTVEWLPIADAAGHKPVNVWVIDASGCQIEYNVPQCQAPPCVDARTFTINPPEDMEIVYIAGHIHVGAYNVTVYNDGNELCSSTAIMGTGSTAGNEKGYVVGIKPCYFGDSPITVKKGSTLTITGFYDSDPYHDAVMSLAYIATVANSGAVAELIAIHGNDGGVVERAGGKGILIAVVCIASVLAVAVAVAVIRHTRKKANENEYFRPLNY